jgi:hypothetical protein
MTKHGTYTGYATHGCRCDECREAKRLRQRELRAAARGESVSTAPKQIHSKPVMMPKLKLRTDGQPACTSEGVDPEWFFSDVTVDRRKAREVCAACPLREKCLTDNLTEPYGIWGGQGRNRRIALAAERGVPWPDRKREALEYVDEAKVIRAMDGEPMELTRNERKELVRRLTRRGVSSGPRQARGYHATGTGLNLARSAA